MVQPTSFGTARASRSLAPSLSPHSSAGFSGADSRAEEPVLRRSFCVQYVIVKRGFPISPCH